MQSIAAYLTTAALALPPVLLSPALLAQDHGQEGVQNDKAEPAVTGPDHWYADYDVALAKAKSEKKALLVDFTGSDWCGGCIRLHDEVFKHEAFSKPASEKFVFCALDFPNSPEAKAKVPNPVRNQELNERFKIEVFPTILVMDHDETVLGRSGYREGGPEKYAAHLDELLTKGRQALVDVKVLTEAFDKGDRKIEVLEQAATKLGDMERETPGVEKMADLVRRAVNLDATRYAALRKTAVKSLLKTGQGDDKTATLGKSMDPKNVDGILELAVLTSFQGIQSLEGVTTALEALEPLLPLKIHDSQVGQFMFVNAAMWCGSPRILNDKERGAPFAKKALEIGVDDNPQLKKMLEDMAASQKSDSGGNEKNP